MKEKQFEYLTKILKNIGNKEYEKTVFLLHVLTVKNREICLFLFSKFLCYSKMTFSLPNSSLTNIPITRFSVLFLDTVL